MTRTKPTDNIFRVRRGGGSWYYTSASDVRAAYRGGSTPMLRNNLVGFRCAQRGCRQQILKVQP